MSYVPPSAPNAKSSRLKRVRCLMRLLSWREECHDRATREVRCARVPTGGVDRHHEQEEEEC
eukprot:5353785-Pyramimonas_sp.AAC.1